MNKEISPKQIDHFKKILSKIESKNQDSIVAEYQRIKIFKKKIKITNGMTWEDIIKIFKLNINDLFYGSYLIYFGDIAYVELAKTNNLTLIQVNANFLLRTIIKFKKDKLIFKNLIKHLKPLTNETFQSSFMKLKFKKLFKQKIIYLKSKINNYLNN